MHKMLNPLSGVVVTGPAVEPLWKEDTPFDMICFLSTHKRLKYMNITKIRESGQLVYQQAGILFNPQQNLSDVHIQIQMNNSETSLSITQHTITASAPIWHEITSNKTSVFLHVLLVRSTPIAHTGSTEANATISAVSYPEIVNTKSLQTGQALYGVVRLVKQARIPKHFHHRHLLADWGLVNTTEIEATRLAMPRDTVISYWKPEVAVKLVSDTTRYPLSNVPHAVYRNVIPTSHPQSPKTPAVLQYKPSLFVDEIGLTTDKYIPLNSSVASLPLHVSFGPLSVPRYLLIAQLEESLRAQTELGFTEKDLDEVRRLISETSLQLLGLTMLAALLHLLFEALAFQSDITFWKENKSLAGLSTRALVTDLISQGIVFLFLLDAEASLLVLGPTGFGLLVQLWKVQKATGLEVHLGRYGVPMLRCQRWALQQADAAAALLDDRGSAVFNDATDANLNTSTDSGGSRGSEVKVVGCNTSQCDAASTVCTATGANSSSVSSELHQNTQEEMERELTRVTLQADSFATTYLSALLFPLVLAFSLRSLLYDRHLSWYSWALSAATGCVYAFGFVLMCPQLYINHQLQSVSHLPWNFLVYKFINTFIDDLFAFIIKMPTMHRLSVFRDDLVFFVYLYQRWVYRVDARRPVEK